MGIILLIVIVPIVEVVAACGNLTVRLVLEFDFTLILLGMVKRRWNDYSARNLINQISATVYNSFAANNL